VGQEGGNNTTARRAGTPRFLWRPPATTFLPTVGDGLCDYTSRWLDSEHQQTRRRPGRRRGLEWDYQAPADTANRAKLSSNRPLSTFSGAQRAALVDGLDLDDQGDEPEASLPEVSDPGDPGNTFGSDLDQDVYIETRPCFNNAKRRPVVVKTRPAKNRSEPRRPTSPFAASGA